MRCCHSEPFGKAQDKIREESFPGVLGTGALIGDRIQALENKQSDLDKQIQANQEELDRQRKELEQPKKERKEY